MTHKQGMNLSMGIGEHLDTLKSSSGSCALFMRPTTFFSTKLSLKIDLMILFTYLKFILLRCFQFSIISSIQTDSRCVLNIISIIYE